MICISDKVFEGIFIEETKNRFLCKVLINNMIHECYVPSASKLENYLVMKNKKVLLVRNKGKRSRTKYSLFAIMYYNKYIILSMMIVNKVLEEYLKANSLEGELYREKYIDKYKADFVIFGDTKIVIEAKGLLATRKNVIFPSVYCYRAIEQLKTISKLLDEGWKAKYFFISLSSIVRTIIINKNELYLEYYYLLVECLNKGMEVKGFNIYYDNNSIFIGNELEIILE